MCFWVLITIFNSSTQMFQKELNADVKTPLIQTQGFPPVTFQHLPKSTLYPKTTRGISGHMKKIKGEQELCRSYTVISELPL